MKVSTSHGGKLKKSITVYTNIPDKDGTVRLTIQGQVWQPVDAEPRFANFGRMTAEAAKSGSLSRKIMVVNNMEEDADLTEPRTTNPAFKADVRAVEPGKKYEVTLSVVSELQVGSNRGKVEVATGIKEMPTLSVPFSAYVMSDVDVQPSRLMLPVRRPVEMRRQFIVRNNTKQPLKISDLKVSNPSLTADLFEMSPGRTFRITVGIPTDYHSPPDGDTLTFKTDSPSNPIVTVPIAEFGASRGAKPRSAHAKAHVPRASTKRKPSPSTSGAGQNESSAKDRHATPRVKPHKAKPADG